MEPFAFIHIQISIDEYPVDRVQAISRQQSQCENMNFSDQIRYNKLSQKVINKGG